MTELVAQGHQTGHFGFSNLDFLATPAGKGQVLDLEIIFGYRRFHNVLHSFGLNVGSGDIGVQILPTRHSGFFRFQNKNPQGIALPFDALEFFY